MAELLVCVHDRSTTGVQSIDVIQPLQGDVVVAVRDGWVWGELELGGPTWFNVATKQRESVSTHPHKNHPFFRIIKAPNVSLANASTLLAPELPLDPLNPSPFLHYRAKFLDKSKIPPATMQNLLDNWNDDSRAAGFLTVNFTAAQINSIVSTRVRVPFP